MLRRSRFLVVAAVLVTALFAAGPVQAATPELTQSSVWQSVLSWWDALTLSFVGSGGQQEGELSVAVGREAARISPNGFAPTDSIEGDDEPSQQKTLNPEEPSTEAGPSISING